MEKKNCLSVDTLSKTMIFSFRTTLRLESLEDAVVLESEDDLLTDKHGCPAYVSPEILRTNSQYSGRAADMWGLGVMLYTMLVGRYVIKLVNSYWVELILTQQLKYERARNS